MVARRFVVGIACASPKAMEAVRVAVGADVELLDAARVPARSSGTMDLVLVGAGTDWRLADRFLAAGFPVALLAEHATSVRNTEPSNTVRLGIWC